MTFHNAQNKNWCFRNGLLEKMETLMLKTQLKKWKKKDLKDKTKQETTKTEIIDEKKPFKYHIWMLVLS